MSKTGIKINLENVDGNAYVILGVCQRELRRNNRMDLWDEFLAEATSGNYDNLLCTVCTWFDATFDEDDEDEDEHEDED